MRFDFIYLLNLWFRFGRDIVKFGSDLVEIRLRYGRDMVEIWCKPGGKLLQTWAYNLSII